MGLGNGSPAEHLSTGHSWHKGSRVGGHARTHTLPPADCPALNGTFPATGTISCRIQGPSGQPCPYDPRPDDAWRRAPTAPRGCGWPLTGGPVAPEGRPGGCVRHLRLRSSSWLSSSSSWGCMPLMDWKRDSTAESLVMLRPRTWLLFMRLTKVVTAFCRAFRNCAWLSSDSPFWYCCRGTGGLAECLRPQVHEQGQGPTIWPLSSEPAAHLTWSSRWVYKGHPQHPVHT